MLSWYITPTLLKKGLAGPLLLESMTEREQNLVKWNQLE